MKTKFLLFIIFLLGIFFFTDTYSQSVYEQDGSADGLIVFEAEAFSNKWTNTEHSWDSISTGTPVGGWAMQSNPDNGTRPGNGVGPCLEYYIDLQSTDTLWVWIKGAGPGSASNNLRYSLDDQTSYMDHAVANSASLDYAWKKQNLRFLVPGTIGLHTFKVWMREDGCAVDKFVISTNKDYGNPTGDGPAVSTSYEINLAPTSNPISNVNVWVGAGAQTIDVTGITDGDIHHVQTVTASVSDSPTGIISGLSVGTVTSGVATISYTPNAVGTVTVTLTLTDDGGTANGGDDTYTTSFDIQVLASEIQNGWTDDFEDGNMNWYVGNAGQYTLTEENGHLQIVGNKNSYWESFGRNINSPIDISANPYMNLEMVVKDSTLPVLINAYIRDGNGTNRNIQKRVSYSQHLHTVPFDFSVHAADVNLADIRSIFFAINGNIQSYKGTVWFEKVMIGDSATNYSYIQPMENMTFYKNTGPHRMFISDCKNTNGFTMNGVSGLVQNASFSAVDAYSVDSLMITLQTDAVGSVDASITAIGASGYTDNQSYFTFTIEDNNPPTIDQLDDLTIPTGVEQEIKLTGITDGNRSISQDLTISAVSAVPGVIANPTIVYTGNEAPYAIMKVTASSAQNDVSITVTVTDEGDGSNESTMTFNISSFDSYNNLPTGKLATEIFTSLQSDGLFKVPIGGISDGDGGTQNLTITATSSATNIVANPIPVSYTQGESVAILEITPDNIGTTTITVVIEDDGNTGSNNGNQSTSFSFQYAAKKDPVTGYVIPLDNIVDQIEVDHIWSPESYNSRYFFSNDSLGTYSDNVIKIDMVDKSDWNGVWVEVPELDLSETPVMSLEIYPETSDIYYEVWWWDADGYRNTTGPSAQVMHCIQGQWNKVFIDFRPEDYLYSKNKDTDIDVTRIDAILFCQHNPAMNWPNTLYSGSMYMRNIRLGDEAEIPATTPVATIDLTPDYIHTEGDGAATIELTGISDGASSITDVTVTVSSSNSSVANPTISATNPDGSATLSYTPGTVGNTDIALTVLAPGSITVRDTFNIGVLSTNASNAISVNINQSVTYQTMRGFGTWYSGTNLDPELYGGELGASAMRIGLINNQLEPINDNSDPYSLDRSKLNYDVWDWNYLQSMHANGVENFIMSVWSAPAWMKENLMTTERSGSNNTAIATNRLSFHMYEEFAEMCVAACRVFEEQMGFELYGIGMQNEPTFHEPYPSGILSAGYFYQLIEVVGQRLVAEGISTRLFMPEQVFSQGGGVSTRAFLDSLQAHPVPDALCPAVAVHGYAPDGIGPGMPDTAQWTTLYNNCQEGPNPKELWMTESNPSGTTWDEALQVAGAIMSSVRYGSVSWWTTWGIQGTLMDATMSPIPGFYSNKHIFKFVRPGAQRIYSKTSNLQLYDCAFINEAADGGNLVLVLINDSTGPVSVELNIGGGTVPASCDVYMSRDLAPTELIASGIPADNLVHMPAKSIVTIVANPNPHPNFDDIPDQLIPESSATQDITITGIDDGEGSSQNLTFTATSSNNGIVPDPVITYSQGSSTATLSYAPTPGITGMVEITVTCTDDGTPEGQTVKKFNVSISGINHTPAFSVPTSVSCNEDAGTQTINLSDITDSDGGTQTLTFRVTEGDPALISTPLLTYSGGSTGTITYTPVADANGTTSIEVTLKDNGGNANGAVDSVTYTIDITVDAVNDEPTLNAVSTQNAQPSVLKTVNLSGIDDGDPEVTQTLSFNTSSDDQAVIADGDISVTYNQGESTAVLEYTGSSNGTATIQVELIDNGGTSNGGMDTKTITFDVNISATANSNPTIDIIDNVSVDEDATQQSISLAGISDGDGGAQGVTITASSSNTAVVDDPSITFSGGATGTLNYTPVANANGTVQITVLVTDGGAPAAETQVQFDITVNPVNDAPTMDAIADEDVLESSSETTIDLSGISDGDEGLQAITITASSNNTGLIPDPIVDYTAGATGSIRFTPVTNENGTAQITLTLEDNGGTANGGVNTSQYTFNINVTSLNSTPTINGVIAQEYLEDEATNTIIITGLTDGGDGGQTLSVSAVEVTDTARLENISVSYTPGETSAQVSYDLMSNANGNATLRVVVNDDGGTADGAVDSAFILVPVVITAVNDQPTIDPIDDVSIAANPENTELIYLSNIVDGDPEIEQNLTITVSSDNEGLFNLLQYDESGFLILVNPSGLLGTATVTVDITDNGGTANGGIDNTSYTFDITFTEGTGWNDISADDIAVYPVPANNELFVNAGRYFISEIQIYDMSGRIVLTSSPELHSTLVNMDVSDIESGAYFMSIQIGNQRTVKQIIIQ